MRTLHLTGLALAISAGMALPLAGAAQAAMGGALPSNSDPPGRTGAVLLPWPQFLLVRRRLAGPGLVLVQLRVERSGYGWGGGDGWHGWNRSAYHGPRSMPQPTHGVRAPVVHAPLVRAPVVQPTHTSKITGGFTPHNKVVRTPQIKGGAFTHGAAPHGATPHGAGPSHGGGGKICPPGGKC